MEPCQHLLSALIRIQLHIVARRIRCKKSVHGARPQQFLLHNPVQQRIAFCKNLPRLLALPLILKNPRINAL